MILLHGQQAIMQIALDCKLCGIVVCYCCSANICRVGTNLRYFCSCHLTAITLTRKCFCALVLSYILCYSIKLSWGERALCCEEKLVLVCGASIIALLPLSLHTNNTYMMTRCLLESCWRFQESWSQLLEEMRRA